MAYRIIQCYDIYNWYPRNEFQWDFSRKSYIFIEEISFQNVVCKMAALLSRSQCVEYLTNTRKPIRVSLILHGDAIIIFQASLVSISSVHAPMPSRRQVIALTLRPSDAYMRQ